MPHAPTRFADGKRMRVRLHRSVCKQMTRYALGGRASAAALLAAACLSIVACHPGPHRRTVSLPQLEQGTVVVPTDVRRTVVRDPSALGEAYSELAPRLGVVVIRSSAEWRQLAKVAPDLGPAPNFDCGAVVGVLSRAGSPVGAEWPVRVKHVRLSDGAGLLVGGFEPGSYLPDGVCHLEAAYVVGLETVLVVDINGLRYVL